MYALSPRIFCGIICGDLSTGLSKFFFLNAQDGLPVPFDIAFPYPTPTSWESSKSAFEAGCAAHNLSSSSASVRWSKERGLLF